MTTLNLSGFETGDTTETPSSSGTFSVVTSPVRSGQYALRCNPAANGAGQVAFGTIGATGADGVMGRTAETFFTFHFRFASLPAGTIRFASVEGPSSIVRVDCTSGGVVRIVGATQSADIGTISAGVWYRFDLRATTNGTCGGKINGGTEQTCTGVNATMQRCHCGRVSTAEANAFDCYYDDVFISDSGFPPNGQVNRLDPDGDGTYTAWGSGTGTTFAEVDDDVPGHDGDTTYISATATGDNTARTFTLETLANAGGAGTITSVKLYTLDRGESIAGTNECFVRLRSGTTNSDCSVAEWGTTYLARQKVYDTDPNTSSAWTETNLNAIEGGVGAAALAQAQRCTKVAVMVWSAGVATAVGTLSQTLAALTLTSAGKVDVAGSLTKTLAALTLTGAGKVDVTGALTKTLAELTLQGIGTVEARAAFAQTLAALTLSSAGTVADVVATGTLTQTLANLTLQAAGNAEARATLAQTLAALTVVTTGSVEAQAALTQTLAALTLQSTSAVEVKGALNQALAALTLSAAGTVADNDVIVGTLTQTLAALTLSGAAKAEIDAALSQTLAAVTLIASGSAEVRGVFAQTLAALTLSGAGTLEIDGTLAQTLAALTLNGAGVAEAQGVLVRTLAPLALSATGLVGNFASGTLTQTLDPLALSATGMVTGGTLPPTTRPSHRKRIERPLFLEEDDELLAMVVALSDF